LEAETELLAAVAAPNDDQGVGFEEIYWRHVQSVSRWIIRLGGNREDLEDLVQEVFATAQRRIPAFRGESQVSTWLFGIASKVVSQERRRRRWRSWLRVEGRQLARDFRGPVPAPDQDLEQQQTIDRFYRILDTLSRPHREVLVLFELEGLSGQRVAELLGIKVASLWVRLHRARAKFLESAEKLERRESRGTR